MPGATIDLGHARAGSVATTCTRRVVPVTQTSGDFTGGIMRKHTRLMAGGFLAVGLLLSTTAASASAATLRPHGSVIPAATTGEQADGRPDFTFAGGALYVAWTGTNSAHNVNVAEANDGTVSGKNTLSDTAIGGTGPALGTALLGGIPQVFAAWAGTDSAHHIYIGHYTGSSTLGCHTALPETTTISPFLVNTAWDGHGTLYLLWTGTDSAHHINIAPVNIGACTSASGQITLGTVVTLTDTADQGPAAADLNGSLWIYWPGTNAAHNIWAGEYTGSATLADRTPTAETSTDSLGAVYNPSTNRNWITYRGTDTRVFVAYTSSTNGADIIFNGADGSNTTPFGVGDGSDPDFVFVGFAGYDSSSTLNIDPFNA